MIRIALLALLLVVSSAQAADLDDANKVHDDGAKDEETVIQVWGMGPATSTPAEQH